MNIKNATTETGIPVKVNQFSLEVFEMNRKEDAMQEIYCSRIEQFYRTSEYIKLHEKFKALCDEIENELPGCKEIINEIDSIVVSKEGSLFDEGYRCGIQDLMTALTFNELQITHASVIDFKAIDKIRKSKAEIK